MEPSNQHIDELIAKYFAGEASPDEAIMLDEWLEVSASNKQYFEEGKKALQVKDISVDTQKMFAAVLSQIDTSTHETKIVSIKPFFTPLRIAASLLIVSTMAIVAAVYFKSPTALPNETIASTNQVKETKLADGSKVALNRNSKLTVIGGYNNKERRLKLEGEAFFEVKHDEKPFVIDAGGVLIKDIGTAFNVNASPLSDSVFVYVTEGIVDMSNETTTLRLEQNESAVYVRSSNQLFLLSMVKPNINSYHTKQFSFKSMYLNDVIDAINLVYGDVLLLENKKLSQCRITVDFNNDSPEMIAIVIAETLGLSYQKTTEGVYVLKGSSCIQ